MSYACHDDNVEELKPRNDVELDENLFHLLDALTSVTTKNATTVVLKDLYITIQNL